MSRQPVLGKHALLNDASNIWTPLFDLAQNVITHETELPSNAVHRFLGVVSAAHVVRASLRLSMQFRAASKYDISVSLGSVLLSLWGELSNCRGSLSPFKPWIRYSRLLPTQSKGYYHVARCKTLLRVTGSQLEPTCIAVYPPSLAPCKLIGPNNAHALVHHLMFSDREKNVTLANVLKVFQTETETEGEADRTCTIDRTHHEVEQATS